MPKEVSRRLALTNGDFLDVRLVVERGVVLEFVVNYTAVIEEREQVVCRYDTCHGHLHVHRYWLRGGAPKDLEDPAHPAKSYSDKLAQAEADIKSNWREYRAKMELKQ